VLCVVGVEHKSGQRVLVGVHGALKGLKSFNPFDELAPSAQRNRTVFSRFFN